MRVMEPSPTSERNTAIVAAIGRGVSLRTVCAVYDIDAMTVRSAVEAAGQQMPVEPPGATVLIARREAEMLRRALEGEDFSVIARAHDDSREWVRIVVKKHTGLSAKDLKGARDAARQQFKVQRARDLASSDLPLDELADQSGLSVRQTESILGPEESARRRRARNVPTAMDRRRILDDLRRVASLQGGTPLSGPFYDRHRGEGLSSARIVQIFDTWSAACAEAGVEAPSAARAQYTQGWSREDCLRWVLEYLRSTERPTYAGYESWSRGRDGAPSAGIVRLRCGKWIATVSDSYALDAGDTLGPVGALVDGRGVAAPSSAVSPTPDDRPMPEDEASAAEEPVDPEEGSGQGRLYELERRLKLEMAAQERLMAHYRSRGWHVIDTHIGSPYDAVATLDDEMVYLEAKGTQSSGATVLVTRGEVEHARAHPGRCFVGIWSGIEFDDGNGLRPELATFASSPSIPNPVNSRSWATNGSRASDPASGPTWSPAGTLTNGRSRTRKGMATQTGKRSPLAPETQVAVVGVSLWARLGFIADARDEFACVMSSRGYYSSSSPNWATVRRSSPVGSPDDATPAEPVFEHGQQSIGLRSGNAGVERSGNAVREPALDAVAPLTPHLSHSASRPVQ